jgi:mannosyltransferase OCH1-like enzyme
MIPKVIHKVCLVDSFKLPELPAGIQQSIQTFRDLNPEYTLKIYSGDDCVQYIKDHFDEKTLKAFHKVKPYSYKCDLFRFLVLYNEGGWYSDLRQICLCPIDKLTSSNHEFYVAIDAPPNQLCMYTAFIGSIKGHPILKKTIEYVIWNIEHEHYGLDCLYPTGPGAFMTGAIDYIRRHPEKCCVGAHVIGNDTKEFVIFGKNIAVQCKYNNARGSDNSDLKGSNSYGSMWVNNEVYNKD